MQVSVLGATGTTKETLDLVSEDAQRPTHSANVETFASIEGSSIVLCENEPAFEAHTNGFICWPKDDNQ